jgi:hypothetical protein
MRRFYRAISDGQLYIADKVCIKIEQGQLFKLIYTDGTNYLLQKDFVTFEIEKLVLEEGFREVKL